jgi:hypothetical protein
MAELPVRHRTLAPFGGITRIRFKGFDQRFAPIISATAAPPHFSLGENKTRICEVNQLSPVVAAVPAAGYRKCRRPTFSKPSTW